MHASGTPLAHTGEGRLADSLFYNLARFIGAPFSYDVIGYENIQTRGPAVYIANHLGAVGPIETILSVPVRFYPWIIAEMMNFKQAPQYLYDDFVHPALHLHGKKGLLFSTFLTKISVRLFRWIGAVSIDRFGGLTTDGFRHSLRLLREGKNLLIFPEDPLQELDPDTSMRPFMPGFASLCHIFQTEQNSLLPVYPIAVHASSETVSIGKPEILQPRKNHREAVNEFSQHMEEWVRELYLDLKKTNDELLA